MDDLLILLLFAVGAIAFGYLVSFAIAYIRDLRRLPAKTPDLRNLNSKHPNVSLWKRRMREDPGEIVTSIKRGLSTSGALAIVLSVIALLVVGLAALVYGGVKVFSVLASAPGWAVIIIVLLVIIAFK